MALPLSLSLSLSPPFKFAFAAKSAFLADITRRNHFGRGLDQIRAKCAFWMRREKNGKQACTVLSWKVKTRLRELAPAARGSQDAGSRNLVFTF